MGRRGPAARGARPVRAAGHGLPLGHDPRRTAATRVSSTSRHLHPADAQHARHGHRPSSFYQRRRRPSHYDGLPVDFTAAAITARRPRCTGASRPSTCSTPTTTASRWTPSSTGSSRRATRSQRIDDYGDWVDRFETAMRGLPEPHATFGAAAAGHLPPAGRFRRRLAGAGGDFAAVVEKSRLSIPHVSKELICKYLTDLKLIGALEQ